MGCFRVKVARVFIRTAKDFEQVTHAVSVGIGQTVATTHPKSIQLVSVAVTIPVGNGVAYLHIDRRGRAVASIV